MTALTEEAHFNKKKRKKKWNQDFNFIGHCAVEIHTAMFYSELARPERQYKQTNLFVIFVLKRANGQICPSLPIHEISPKPFPHPRGVSWGKTHLSIKKREMSKVTLCRVKLLMHVISVGVRPRGYFHLLCFVSVVIVKGFFLHGVGLTQLLMVSQDRGFVSALGKNI